MLQTSVSGNFVFSWIIHYSLLVSFPALQDRVEISSCFFFSSTVDFIWDDSLGFPRIKWSSLLSCLQPPSEVWVINTCKAFEIIRLKELEDNNMSAFLFGSSFRWWNQSLKMSNSTLGQPQKKLLAWLRPCFAWLSSNPIAFISVEAVVWVKADWISFCGRAVKGVWGCLCNWPVSLRDHGVFHCLMSVNLLAACVQCPILEGIKYLSERGSWGLVREGGETGRYSHTFSMSVWSQDMFGS